MQTIQYLIILVSRSPWVLFLELVDLSADRFGISLLECLFHVEVIVGCNHAISASLLVDELAVTLCISLHERGAALAIRSLVQVRFYKFLCEREVVEEHVADIVIGQITLQAMFDAL